MNYSLLESIFSIAKLTLEIKT